MITLKRIVPILFLLAASASPAPAQSPGKFPIEIRKGQRINLEQIQTLTSQAGASERTTEAELAALKAKNPIRFGPQFKPVDKKTAAEGPPRGDLYADSMILSDGINHTILPKGSLIHVPEKYAGRVISKPKGKLLFWPEFFAANRTWVRPHEVTLQTVEGETPIAESMQSRFQLQKFVVVSVLRGSPITVLPPKDPEGDKVSSATGGNRFDAASRTTGG